MILPVSKLPSRGLGYKIPEITINPLGYRKLLEYSNCSCISQSEKLLRDIRYLITDLPGWETYNLYDLKALIFTRKHLTITEMNSFKTDKIKCPKCHELFTQEINIADIDFTPIPENIQNLSSIKIGGVDYAVKPISTIKEFYDCVSLFESRGVEFDLKIAYLSTVLDFVTHPSEIDRLLNSATYSDVQTLEVLYKYVSGMMTPLEIIHNGCGGDVKVQFDNLIVDLFRLVKINNPFNENAFNFSEGISH